MQRDLLSGTKGFPARRGGGTPYDGTCWNGVRSFRRIKRGIDERKPRQEGGGPSNPGPGENTPLNKVARDECFRAAVRELATAIWRWIFRGGGAQMREKGVFALPPCLLTPADVGRL